MENIAAIIANLKAEIVKLNNNQQDLRNQQNLRAPQYIAHGSHMSPEEFSEKISEDVARLYPNSKDILPKFSKETQNELNIIKNFREKHPEIAQINGKELQQRLAVPARVFGIPTTTEFDADNNPIPQDGSYAYAIKKASASINFTEDGVPLLIGTEKGYKPFEEGTSFGHIYIAKGDSFKPEIDESGKITEYTSEENTPVFHHIKVNPKTAMQHNVQFVMFKTEQNAIDWYDSNKSKFSNTISSTGERMQSLAHEIKEGRATYINAASRGENPKIPVLEKAEKVKENRLKYRFADMRNKLNKNEIKVVKNKSPDLSNTDFSKLRVLYAKKIRSKQ